MLSSLGGSNSLPTGALAAFGMKSSTELYVALMLSPPVEDAVISRFNLREEYKSSHLSRVRKTFERNAQVVADKSGIISVSMVDKDPQRAAEMANAIVQAYDTLSSHLAITDAARSRLFFEHQVQDTRLNLARAEDDLRNTTARTGIVEPTGAAHALLSYEAQLRAQITAKTVELQSKKVYDSAENIEVQTAEQELQSLRSQLASLGDKAKDDSGFSKATESNASLEYARKYREVRYNETLFELLLKNLELAKLDEAREGSVVQVISVASTPDLKDGPHRSFFAAGGLILGFLFSAAWVLLKSPQIDEESLVSPKAPRTAGEPPL